SQMLFAGSNCNHLPVAARLRSGRATLTDRHAFALPALADYSDDGPLRALFRRFTSGRDMSGRQILVFSGLLIAIGTALLTGWQSPFGWFFCVAAAGLVGLAAGIAWEHRCSARLGAENENLKRQAEHQTAELAQAKKLSGELQSEAAQALRDSE